MGEVWIFSGIAHSTPANGLVHPRGVMRYEIISAPPTFFFYQYVSFYQFLISTRLRNCHMLYFLGIYTFCTSCGEFNIGACPDGGYTL